MTPATIPTRQPYEVMVLHYCESCGRLCVLRCGFKYCRKCGQQLLAPDPIDMAIAEMIAEQENLLNRKYIRMRLAAAQ